MSNLRILILSDGRPGHFNLSEGISAAIGRRRKTTITRQQANRGRWPGGALAALATSHMPAAQLLRRVYGLEATNLPASDLVISAGAETLAANIWAARHLAAPNIFYGSIRLFDPNDFNLVLTSYPSRAARVSHAVTLKPSPFDPDSLAPHRDRRDAPRPLKIALIIGGDAPGINYTTQDWTELFRAIEDLHASSGATIVAANSRRTPAIANRLLEQAALERATGIETFIDYRSAGPGTLSPAIAGCDVALCTIDSSSMLSECVWLRLPTIALAPKGSTLERNEATYRSWLEQRGLAAAVAISDLTQARLDALTTHLVPLRTNPLDDLANLIDRRIPGLLS